MVWYLVGKLFQCLCRISTIYFCCFSFSLKFWRQCMKMVSQNFPCLKPSCQYVIFPRPSTSLWFNLLKSTISYMSTIIPYLRCALTPHNFRVCALRKVPEKCFKICHNYYYFWNKKTQIIVFLFII